jgi:hypothetical protein
MVAALYSIIPRLEAHFVEEDDPHVNPLGVKGVAEIALAGRRRFTDWSAQRAAAS